MALVVAGGRPAAASFAHPLQAIATWFAQLRAAQAQREALAYLLELDHHRLADLGINRADLFDAVYAEPRSTRLLAERRKRQLDLNP